MSKHRPHRPVSAPSSHAMEHLLRSPTAQAVAQAFGTWPTGVLASAVVLSSLLGVGDAAAQARAPLPDHRTMVVSPGGRVAVDSSRANQLTLTQSTNTAVLNWQSFEVQRGNTVTFNHATNQNFVSINKINDPKGASTIDGSLISRTGQIYLINPSGVMFGANAQVDVAGLIASSLAIDESRVTNGLLAGGSTTPAFSAAVGAANGKIEVAQGARIRVGGQDETGTLVKAGNLFFFAPTIDNRGTLEVGPGGQIVLAAGQKVYLAASDEASLRGVLVEVGDGGTVTNGADGLIRTARGNVTMVGMAVNQAGRITATSAINENGSIRLLARERQDGTIPSYKAAGSVTLKAGSTTEVLLDGSDTKVAPLSDPNAATTRSTIEVAGKKVTVGDSSADQVARVIAHGGDVTLTAHAVPQPVAGEGQQQALLGTESAEATLSVGTNARIDVSGERDVAVDGSRNFVRIDRLTTNDMADAPLQKEGFLKGQGVYVDLTQDHAFINLSNRQAAVSGTQAERNASGGNIALRAEGRLDVAKGAVLDVSGGTTHTSAAAGRTSQLLTASGKVVDIMDAKADEVYVGMGDQIRVERLSNRDGIDRTDVYDAPVYSYRAAHVDGKDAGTVEINAPRGEFGGTIKADVSAGSEQRSNRPQGGRLLVGKTVDGTTALNVDTQIGYSRGHVLLANDVVEGARNFTAAQQERLLAFDADALRSGGVTRVDVLSDGKVVLAKDSALDLGVKGSLAISANQVEVRSDVTAAGGSIALGERLVKVGPDASSGDLKPQPQDSRTRSLVNRDGSPALTGEVLVGQGVTLDVGGRITNDLRVDASTTPSSAIARDGGSITIAGMHVDVAGASGFHVDAGATVSKAGAVQGGKAGSVTITARDVDPITLNAADVGALNLGADFAGRISGFGFSKGGSLTLGSASMALGAPTGTGAAAAGATPVETAVYDRGFEKVTLDAGNRLDVGADARIAPVVRQYVAGDAVRAVADGAKPATQLTPQAPLPLKERAVSLGFNAKAAMGEVHLAKGAVIDAGVGGTISSTAGLRIEDQATLKAAGGTVSLSLDGSRFALKAPQLPLDTARRHAVHLGDSAHIEVSGVERVQTDNNGVRSGSVLDGGSVTINAERGAVLMDAGSTVRAEGATGQVDVRQAGASQRIDVASRGGNVTLSAMAGMTVGADISGRSGSDGVEGGRLKVRLSDIGAIARDAHQTSPGQEMSAEQFELMYQDARQIVVAPTRMADKSTTTEVTYGQARIGTGLINDSGFDTVSLVSAHSVTVKQDVQLQTRASLSVEAQALRVEGGARMSLASQQLTVGASGTTSSGTTDIPGAAQSQPGGSVNLQGRQVSLAGNLRIEGAATTQVQAQDDVVVRGRDGTIAAGALSTSGDLTVTAAQLVPASFSTYTLKAGADSAPATLTVSGNGHAPLEPLSYGGSVNLEASQVIVSGTVHAPHGHIGVKAAEIARIEPNAVLSVAGSSDVPVGTVFNASHWVYGTTASDTNNLNLADPALGADLPEKSIDIVGKSVRVSPKARIDLSAGGGEAVTQEFIAGPGGSTDVRLNFITNASTGSAERNTLFALIPARGDATAAYDPAIYADLNLNAAAGDRAGFRLGQVITLAGGSGIPAGRYTVLPPRYALLPGAFAVQAVVGATDMQPGTVLREATGTVVVAGKWGAAGAGDSSSRWSGVRVYDGRQLRKLAEFREYEGGLLASGAAEAARSVAPRTASDAAELRISGDKVALSASAIQAAPARQASGGMGRGPLVALSAPSVTVSDAAEPGDGPATATLALQSRALNALGAESLVLGDTATAVSEFNASEKIGLLTGALQLGGAAPAANTVTLSGSTGLSAGEVILVASKTVSVEAGTKVLARADRAPVTQAIRSSGDGATLVVSEAGAGPTWVREGATGVKGDLVVGANTQVRGASVVFDGSRSTNLASSMTLDTDQVSLSAARINLGDAPSSATGLILNDELLGRFKDSGALTLTSGSTFDVYGQATLGSAAVRQLTLDGSAFVAHGTVAQGGTAAKPSASLTVTAGDIELRNSTVGVAPAATALTTGTGQLTVHAVGGPGANGNVVLQGATPDALTGQKIGGGMQATGFAQTTVIATGQAQVDGSSRIGTGELRLQGTQGGLSVDGALTLDAARIASGVGAEHTLAAQGLLKTEASSAASAYTSEALGAKVALTARAVDHGGRIELPSGSVSLMANGNAATDHVTLRKGATVNVGGSTQAFAGTTADAPAGQITLTSTGGNVVAEAGSRLNLSGAGTQGDAGQLHIRATKGTATLAGAVDARAPTVAQGATKPEGAQSAVVSVDVARMETLSTVASPLADDGQLQSLSVRVRQGDTRLDVGTTLQSSRIILAADGADATAAKPSGQMAISGTLNADGVQGGQIELHAARALTLSESARLTARAQDAKGQGGEVLLSAGIQATPMATAAAPAIVLKAGSIIDVSSTGGAAQGGTVTLRAPVVAGAGAGAARTVAVSSLPAGSVKGARRVTVEPTVVQAASGSVDAATQAQWATAVKGVMAADNQTAMRQQLGSAVAVDLRPGLEVRSSGNLSLDSALDLAATDATGRYAWRVDASGNAAPGTTATAATGLPGTLKLRAAGALALNQGITDGRSAAGEVFTNGESWNLGLTGGADLSAANPDVVHDDKRGNVTLAAGTQVRTGTGDIHLNAAGDVALGSGAGVATTGVAAASVQPASIPAIYQAYKPTFTTGAGSVSVVAGNDVTGAAPPSGATLTNWMRWTSDPSGKFDTQWWFDATNFADGFAAAGAKVDVRAGGNVQDLNIASASQGYTTGVASGGVVAVHKSASGGVNVQAGGDIATSNVVTDDGSLRLRADAVKSDATNAVHLAVGDTQADVIARTGVSLGAVYNPSLSLAGAKVARASTSAGTGGPRGSSGSTTVEGSFSTYSSDAAVRLSSLTGDLTFVDAATAMATAAQSGAGNLPFNSDALNVLPASVQLTAFGGSIHTGPKNRLLFPSATGQLSLLADQNVTSVLVMADRADKLPTPARPVEIRGIDSVKAYADLMESGNWSLQRPANHGLTPLHTGDTQSAVVVARHGDITATRVEVPKALHVDAAGDIKEGSSFYAQHLSGTDHSHVHAGEDMVDAPINVAGPGHVEVLAGRKLDLGATTGIVASGNLSNPRLPEGSAKLVVAAGLGVGQDGFVQRADYTGVLERFVRFDAFAAAGSSGAALNAQVLEGLDADARAQLASALTNREAALQSGSAFRAWLAGLGAGARAQVALKLATQVQAVANSRFVQTANTDTFLPGYLALQDLFPSLANHAGGLRQFLQHNPFDVDGVLNAAAQQRLVVEKLPDGALKSTLLLGLDTPAQVGQTGSAFEVALAKLDAGTLQAGGRQLLASAQATAGVVLDALRRSGRVSSSQGTPFARKLDELGRAFSPLGPVGVNDVSLVYSQVKTTQAGGDLYLLAPRGGVLVGQANPPPNAIVKEAAELGMLTLGNGGIATMVRDNVDVYRSRVFTVAGGNIHLWSSLGNVDAGRGPRDAVSAPTPTLVIDEETGVATLDISSTISGSGIGALKTRDDQPASDIRLVAPNGFIDAGEAGIRAEAGSVTLGTNIVLNAGNIAAGGGVSGGAVVVAPPAPLPAAATSSGGDKAVEQTQKALSDSQKEAEERAKKERRKRVTGEFIGYGDD